MLLRTLKHRGESMETGLEHVLSLLISDDWHQRSTGWAALLSIFPEIAKKIYRYRVDMPDADRHEAVERLRGYITEARRRGESVIE